jgi:hypothetical protein
MEKVAKMALEESAKLDPPVTVRVYTASIAPFDQVVVDFEYEDLAAYEKAWADWFDKPETPDFMEKWNELTKSGGKNEIWDLVE